MNLITRQAILRKYVRMQPIERTSPPSNAIKDKVLISPHGIGIGTLARALRAGGVHAAACSLYQDQYSYLSDICLNLNQHPMVLRKAIRDAFLEEALETYDIFHFRFGATFTGDKRDLKTMAARGKKLVVHHCGDEARILSVARSFNNPYVQSREAWPEERIRANMKLLTACVDHVIINDHELLPHVESYYKRVHIVPYAIDAKQFKPEYPSPNATPLVVHAPSHRRVKGTDFVLNAVERLQKEGHKFQFQLVEKMPHEQAKQLYQKATIVIDQLTVGTYANLSMEAMAMGKPVICHIREDLRDSFPPGLPIVGANPDTIYEVLRDVLRRPDEWGRLGAAGRRYVEQNHNYEKVARMLIDVYKQL
ncbi:glycosyltransferase family 4 protein [Paenibacillus antri]|nr:glycosyltransferase family 4 protein [Paenibacillus antri]